MKSNFETTRRTGAVMANRSDLPSPDLSSAAHIEGREQAGRLTVISCVHGKPTEFSNTHPCTTFAQSAGFASWEAAVDAMKAGRVLLGRASMTEFLLFQRQIERDRLRSLPVDTWSGQFSVGCREYFAADAFVRDMSEDDAFLVQT
jgi:hypothetical protein